MTSITVIIPVYNAALYLAEAMTSVLTQTHPPDEVLVIDDGSTDDSAAIARRFEARVQLVQQPNQGAAASRNRGVALAQGQVLAFLDADDVWLPDKLARQLAALTTTPAPDIILGQVEQFRSPDLPAEIHFADEGRVMNGLHVGAMLIPAGSFQQVGPFRSDLAVGEFIDWYSRAMAHSLSSLILPEVVMRRRLHGQNLMRRTQSVAGSYLKLLREAAARHKEARTRQD
ncbi:MAG TPA: glycosyltransferase family A protein [Anaerolineae bacterium]|nr:glycosyltransferase family A protein [Anaerolineae bacterium]